MISRRHAIVGALSSLLTARIHGQGTNWRTALEDYLKTQNPITLGHVLPPPDDKVWSEAHDILSAAPEKTTPYRIAKYFRTSVPEKFQRSWPEPDYNHPTFANPVIVLFFVATQSTPAGDTTPWCAAFVNWCLQRGGMKGTMSVSSKNFKTWGTAVWSRSDGALPTSAKTGDIAVFSRKSSPGTGHVCFFSQLSNKHAGSIEIIGGNQIHGKKPNQVHLIDFDTMRVDGDLELHSVRTIEGLRDA